jgi:phosphoenolpyruvate carboxylase
MPDSTLEHFKCDVRRFDSIDSEIKSVNDKMKPLKDKLKELRDSKKNLETTICSFMQTNEIGECKLQEGALLFKETKNVVPLSKEAIRTNITNFFSEYDNDEFKKYSSEEKAEALFKFVYENREYTENKTLKRIPN